MTESFIAAEDGYHAFAAEEGYHLHTAEPCICFVVYHLLGVTPAVLSEGGREPCG
jgi:hypothetical protein